MLSLVEANTISDKTGRAKLIRSILKINQKLNEGE